MTEAFDESGVAVQEAPAAVQEAAAETDGITIDLDRGFEMEWEVETEPAPQPQYQYQQPYQPRYQEPYYKPYQTGQGYRGTYDRYGRPVEVSRVWNKHIFTWGFSFLLGIYGVDRFVRGQIFIGLLKLFTFGGFGIWWLVDMIIAVLKSYVLNPNSEELLFDRYGNYIN